MKKAISSSLVLGIVSLLAVPALAQDDVRLVVTPEAREVVKNGITQKAAPSVAGCVSAPHGEGQWCLGKRSAQSTSAKSVQNSAVMEVVILDSFGYSAKQVANILTEDGRFGLVEPDLQVKQMGEQLTDDPDFEGQKFYLGSSEKSKLGMNVTEAWADSDYFSEGEKVDVWIMDSSFYENKDVVFNGGASFSTIALERGGERQIPHANFRPNPYSVEQGLCDGHGVGVAGVVAAKINNGLAAAGITNNVNLYGGRVMTCGLGYMSDTVSNIEYLLGKHFDGIEPYIGKPGIINLSIGAYAEDGCPKYIQEPISRAVAAGWTIIVASGNETMPAAKSAPANCEGVISVGSVDSDGELEWFSNYGDDIDLSAAGNWIAAPCDEGEPEFSCFWDGTSFSSPLVAGMAAAIQSSTGASNELIVEALKATANKDVFGSSCGANNCGAGIPDMKAAIAFAGAVMNGEMNTIRYALSDSDTCEQSWLLDNFGASVPMCELYKVSFNGGVTLNANYYELVSVNAGQTWDDISLEVVGTSQVGEVYLRDIDTEARDYGVRICSSVGCSDKIEVMNTVGTSEDARPQSCKN